MENENKNTSTPANQGDVKKHNNNTKRKHHRPKPYFVTPADATQKAEKSSTVPEGNISKQENTQPKKHHNNQTHHKHHQNDNSTDSRKSDVAESPKLNQTTKQGPASQSSAPNVNSNKNRKKHRKNNDRRPQKPELENASPSVEIHNTNDSLSSEDFSFISTSKSDKLEKAAPKKLERFSDSPEYEKYSEYEEFTFTELYGEEKYKQPHSVVENDIITDKPEVEPTPDTEDPLVEVVGIKFKESGKIYYFDPSGITLKLGMHAIVKTARGLEYGDVALSNTMVKESETVPPLRTVVRIATDIDIKHHTENKAKEDEAFRICNEKIIAHGLDMKLIDAQYTFDNSKLLFYFTSSGRVDFRDLVKDLAAIFRTRIELRQVGIRDEAKMVGGFGPCGRALCCSLFLTDFGQVSIKMAKEQNLSLNSSKISGICGRLMCCLRYEYENYEYEIKRTPPVDSLVRTVDGVGVVTEISPLAGTIKVRLNTSPEVAPKTYKREDVTILKKKEKNGN